MKLTRRGRGRCHPQHVQGLFPHSAARPRPHTTGRAVGGPAVPPWLGTPEPAGVPRSAVTQHKLTRALQVLVKRCPRPSFSFGCAERQDTWKPAAFAGQTYFALHAYHRWPPVVCCLLLRCLAALGYPAFKDIKAFSFCFLTAEGKDSL